MVCPAEGIESCSCTDRNLDGSTQINIFSYLPLHWQCDVRQGNSPFRVCGAGLLTSPGGATVDLLPSSSPRIRAGASGASRSVQLGTRKTRPAALTEGRQETFTRRIPGLKLSLVAVWPEIKPAQSHVFWSGATPTEEWKKASIIVRPKRGMQASRTF